MNYKRKEANVKPFLEHVWEEKYATGNGDYAWTDFYMEVANKLLAYKNKRTELIKKISGIYDRIGKKNPLKEKKEDATESYIEDVCPFTIFGLFNRGISKENRYQFMAELAKLLKIDLEIPKNLDGVPVLNNLRVWFFGDHKDRKEEDIDHLWDLFENAILLDQESSKKNEEAFLKSLEIVLGQHGIQWNITMGLFWIRPYRYVTLDSKTRKTITDILGILIKRDSNKKICLAQDYLNLTKGLIESFTDQAYPVHSFPELSYKSWNGFFLNQEIDNRYNLPVFIEAEWERYQKKDFLEEAFLEDEEYETLKELLIRKGNIILQGSPGLGKTFLARRFAYSLLGEKNEDRVKMVQFHQSYSYEDFVMGYRPTEIGFELKEGSFYQFCIKASENMEDSYYFIIDEMNRGNASRIFGELFMLLEKDKRGEEISLIYQDKAFFIPSNLYIIGTMNTADRSIAMIDYALRRRFCFYELQPAFHRQNFRLYLKTCGMKQKLIQKICKRMQALNKEITKDPLLGKGFQIGHSFFCDYDTSPMWYNNIIMYEIKPLLSEYWYEDDEKVDNYIKMLLED